MRTKLLNKRLLILLATILTFTTTHAQSGWEEVYSTTDVFMRDICFVPGSDGLWNTGWAITFQGDVIKTTDGGDTWTEITQSESTSLSGISFADETTGYISTLDNKILKSLDGGLTWSEVYNGTVNFDKVEFKDALNGIASGTSVLYTTDGGNSWLVGSGGSSYWYIDYASGDTYYGVNLGGSLGRSTDGGENWSDIEDLDEMAFSTEWYDANHGFFGGDVSTVKSTVDGGNTWITNTLGDGQDAINCGDYFDADTAYACGSSGEIFKSTDQGMTWVSDTAFSSGVFQPRGFVVTGMNVLFAAANTGAGNGKIWRKIGHPTIEADFEADQTEVCEGSTVNFTDLSVGNIDSWSWTFEGGTPATSPDQNPTVTYSTPGNYYVKLVVTIGSLEDSLTRTDYINVFELPTQADEPAGETTLCSGNEAIYTTDEVAYAQEYEWEISDPGAAVLTWDMTEATLDVEDTYAGTFTIKVRATNVCGEGDWSDELEITVNASPDDFNLLGGGEYCSGDEGVEITLSGSETGVDYELFLDTESTGVIIPGTGSEISFGFFTEEGFYEAVGTNGNCELPMVGQVEVSILYPPVEPEAPVGPTSICEETTSDYTSEGSDNADNYVWEISPEEAGTISSIDLEATVTCNSEFTGTAMISLYGINDCGNGNSSEVLEVSVGSPNPVITGEEMVCDFSTESYEVVITGGSTFTWSVSGGEITEGQGTSFISVAWNGEGNGTVIVEEETVDGCIGSSDEFEVFIDDCTSIEENDLNKQVSIYPNPARDYVKIETETNLISIAIFTLTGEIVLNENTTGLSFEFNTSGFKSGSYILKINTNKGVISKRLVVE